MSCNVTKRFDVLLKLSWDGRVEIYGVYTGNYKCVYLCFSRAHLY